jgi:hypothetical protein
MPLVGERGGRLGQHGPQRGLQRRGHWVDISASCWDRRQRSNRDERAVATTGRRASSSRRFSARSCGAATEAPGFAQRVVGRSGPVKAYQRLDCTRPAAGARAGGPRLPLRPRLSWAPAPPPGAGATRVAESTQTESVGLAMSRRVAALPRGSPGRHPRRSYRGRHDLSSEARRTGESLVREVSMAVGKSSLMARCRSPLVAR